MSKFAFVVLALLASKGVVAGEVGANDPKLAEPVKLAYAAVETGADQKDDWAIGPVDFPVTAKQYNQITSATNLMNHQVVLKLNVELYKQLESNF